jgi:hypothetical protein
MNLSLQENELVLSFPYDEALVTVVREIPGSRWDKKSRTWRFLLTPHTYMNIRETLDVSCEEVEQMLATRARVNIDQHKFKTKPYDHQMEGLLKILINHYGMEVFHGKDSGDKTAQKGRREVGPVHNRLSRQGTDKQHNDRGREPIDI